MAIYDAQGGPDGDRKPKGLRRQWYAWFKVAFAQPFSAHLAEHGDAKEANGFDGTAWSARQSKVCGALVDKEGVTYADLWIKDASRMMFAQERLFAGLNLVVAVEKDSLVQDFKTAAKALGARSLVSGKGKQSKAATELQLREHFGWGRGYGDPAFTEERPLVVLHITDHDMDGQAVIGPTFGEQARRYTPHVLEARVGVKPEHVGDWAAKWYEVKTNNAGYTNWADVEGLFVATCEGCTNLDAWYSRASLPAKVQTVASVRNDNAPTGETADAAFGWLVQGVGPHVCPVCGTAHLLTVKVGKNVVDQPMGFEVEALSTRAYYSLLVDTLLEVVPFETIVANLRDECTASSRRAARRILDGEILPANASYAALKALQNAIDRELGDFEARVMEALTQTGRAHEARYWSAEEDPEPADFTRHVLEASDWTGPWAPFDPDARTTLHRHGLAGLAAEQIAAFCDEVLDVPEVPEDDEEGDDYPRALWELAAEAKTADDYYA